MLDNESKRTVKELLDELGERLGEPASTAALLERIALATEATSANIGFLKKMLWVAVALGGGGMLSNIAPLLGVTV